MYVAMNRITVQEGKGPEFEAAFAGRARQVEHAPGFHAFHLLRPEQGNTYATLTMWESKDAFEGWKRSEGFAASHRGTASEGLLAGRPVMEAYEAVVSGTPEATMASR